jgi:hypothetical protein
MKQNWIILLCVCFVCGCCNRTATTTKKEVSYVQKIWDNGNHSAFTSLLKCNGKYYCSFREGESHIFDKDGKAEGKARIIVSDDGERWESLLLMGKKTFDLRDPKLSVTPQGKIMVLMGGSVYENKTLKRRVPHVSFSSDGKNFTPPTPIQLDKDVETGADWLWRVTWDSEGVGYGVVYSQPNDSEGDHVISLVKTVDGANYQLVAKLDVTGNPNEATVRMFPDKRMGIMVRRESDDQKGYWGVSSPPYTEWTWTKMEMRLGGQDFIVLENGKIIAGTRSHYIPSFPKTVLLAGNDQGKFQEIYVLPSGGDTSYPGLLIEGDELWVSYYSTHETGKAAVYLAKLPLAMLGLLPSLPESL